MGKKDKKEVEPVAPSPPTNEADEEDDSPVIVSLKAIDDKYCTIEVELEKEIEKLRKKFNERQAPLLEERRKILTDFPGADKKEDLGTPACPDFWLDAMRNSSELEECVHDCDEPVLKYLDEIKYSDVDAAHPQKGTRLEFTFKENPFFTNTVLWLESHTDYSLETYKPYKEPECIAVKSCNIDWKAGKNVTVEKKVKEMAGKKGGKKKPGKAVEEPVPSFFRILFNNVKRDEPLPESLECVYEEEDDGDDDMTEMHLDNMNSIADFMRCAFLPYAVRYYTGEACEDDDDFDEDGESEEDDDDDDEDDDDSEEEAPAARGRQGNKKPAAKKGAAGAPAGEKTEECKQQ